MYVIANKFTIFILITMLVIVNQLTFHRQFFLFITTVKRSMMHLICRKFQKRLFSQFNEYPGYR